ncbi:phosphotransferase [Dactylosporangium matsuzakiense]|uniref:phosphotransferase n=1 Tax=Dactylosporangium matsuzakiense TaxID=53360 RepID=UPI0022F2DE59|nr:phosphotransferase [Dactylosporangium matsuzakiense]
MQLRDRAGHEWFLKQHRDRDRYLAEVTAYLRWVPTLSDHAPRLRAHDATQRAIILSALPGHPARWPTATIDPTQIRAETAMHHQAGALLRRLHNAHSEPQPQYAAARLEELELLTRQAANLLTPGELGFARTEIQALASLPAPRLVPCHRDYTMRNWLIDSGKVYMLDFEWTQLNAWVTDLTRLHIGPWRTRPDLRDAFLDGYGRELDDADRVLLRADAALTTVWLVIKARESDQESFERANREALHRLMAEAW